MAKNNIVVDGAAKGLVRLMPVNISGLNENSKLSFSR